MGRMIFDILETNIAVSVAIALLWLFAEKLRRRYGTGWLKWVWVLLAVRLLIPYNFSSPYAGIRLFDHVGFEQEGRSGSPDMGTGQSGNQAADMEDDREARGADGQTGTMEGDPMAAGGKGQVSGPEERQQAQSHTDTAAPQTDLYDIVTGIGQRGIAVAGISRIDAAAAGIGGTDAAMADRLSGLSDRNMESGTAGQSGTEEYFSYTGMLIRIWLAGLLVSILYFLSSYLLFADRCRKSLRPVEDTQLAGRIGILQKKYLGRTAIPICQSKAVSSPMITGLLRPKLVLPAAGKAWKKTELELVMAHEFCHYRNKDLWLKILMAAACSVNWFNPMVYVMKRQFSYEMELACDHIVLMGRDEEEREIYARVMLSFAGGRRGASVFSTGFGEDQKQMKRRIDHMLDTGAKKKGIMSIALTAAAVLIMGTMVSCGYRPEDGNVPLKQDETDNVGLSDFDYNHAYNHMLRSYQGDLYLSGKDGIYCLRGGQGEEELIYSNHYELYRGMELDGKYLYFCGSTPEGNSSAAVVCRMDLDTREVVSLITLMGVDGPGIDNVSVYEGKLYVADGHTQIRTGYEFDDDGKPVGMLDSQAEDLLYREYNDYMQAETARLSAAPDSEEYQRLSEEQHQKYQAVMDVASCKKLLDGRQIVSRYKDESSISIYLENEEGTYEYLCDTVELPILITEDRLYYQNASGEIWYVDYETKRNGQFYAVEGGEREGTELSLMTYDAEFVYLLQSREIGEDMDHNIVAETYLIRIPRAGGEARKVYRFAQKVEMYGENGWYRHCGVYNGRMYFDNRESISLDPDVNNMQAVNSGQPCEDAVEIRRAVQEFTAAYFENDEETLHALLTEDYEGETQLYAYPDQAEHNRAEYIGGGIPDENVAVGVTCNVYCRVYYESDGHGEEREGRLDLSMAMIKTQDGFRIREYEITDL